MSVSSEVFRERQCSKSKLTVCRVLRRCNNLDENLARTRLRHVYEANGDTAFGHKSSSLFDGSHSLFLAYDEQEQSELYSPNGPSSVMSASSVIHLQFLTNLPELISISYQSKFIESHPREHI